MKRDRATLPEAGTRNEIAVHRAWFPNNALIVEHSIALTRAPEQPKASGRRPAGALALGGKDGAVPTTSLSISIREATSAVDAFVQKLRARPEFAKEVATPPGFDAHLAATRKAKLQAGKTFEMGPGSSRRR
jgi:hypothetical protein